MCVCRCVGVCVKVCSVCEGVKVCSVKECAVAAGGLYCGAETQGHCPGLPQGERRVHPTVSCRLRLWLLAVLHLLVPWFTSRLSQTGTGVVPCSGQ